MLAILLIPAALCYTFGVMVGDTRQGWAILAAMLVIFVPLTIGCIAAEQAGNPALTGLGTDQQPSATQPGGNMEGKEARFGIANSALWACATTAASNGSVNSMHDSYTPLGGLIPMWLMQLGEVIFGGVGSGLYGMLMFAHRPVRQLRRSHGGRARQGPGRYAAQDQRPNPRGRQARARRAETVPAARCAKATRLVRAGRSDPRRWRGHRRHRQRGRIGHHRRERAGDPRIRRRPQRGHGRHQGALRPDQDQDHVQPGRDVSRPHDRAGGRRRAAEDAQRDRAEHPDRRPDADLPAGGGDAAALRQLQRLRRGLGHCADGGGAGFAAGLPDSHDHRRPCSPPSASPAWTA